MKLKIIQINLNKSKKAHLDIINKKVSHKYDIMLIQEPYTTAFNGVRTPSNFRPVFPKNRFKDDSQIRSMIWVNKHLETRYWKAVDVPNTNDITAIQLSGAYGKVTIFNIYNDCTHSRNKTILSNFLIANRNRLINPDGHGESHLIWAGHIETLHCTEWFNSRNAYTVPNQLSSRGPLNP